MHPGPRDIRSERGTAMIEFALIMPVLFFLLLGIVDFGRAMNYWNNTNQIAADAARFAAVNRNPGEDAGLDFRDWIRSQAETRELATGTLDAANTEASPSTRRSVMRVCVDVAPPMYGRNVGDAIRVRVEQSFYLIPLLGQSLQWPSVAINGQAVMRLEQQYTGPAGCDDTLPPG